MNSSDKAGSGFEQTPKRMDARRGWKHATKQTSQNERFTASVRFASAPSALSPIELNKVLCIVFAKTMWRMLDMYKKQKGKEKNTRKGKQGKKSHSSTSIYLSLSLSLGAPLYQRRFEAISRANASSSSSSSASSSSESSSPSTSFSSQASK